VIQNPGFLLDHPQNLITCTLCHARHSLKISEKSVHNFLSYLANTQTNKQTNRQTKTGKNITSLAEVIIQSYAILYDHKGHVFSVLRPSATLKAIHASSEQKAGLTMGRHTCAVVHVHDCWEANSWQVHVYQAVLQCRCWKHHEPHLREQQQQY